MPREDVKAPPKEKPWFRCSNEDCPYWFRGYHGKIGCECHVCDTKTPQKFKDMNDLEVITNGET